eukprot:CAMPEP_0179952148 /NCGR_PEP_ID=MMETSP0983-20121128/24086_1 /TAXON_ID=483367 /ORGANISM="non described non described, Strain CCMP 2436" /LENGTH=81 /DNA_ID=CAMNT_0021862679 /DNA_START=135 /DNA_END=377 /DNA_ORIENTATION=+
MSHDARQHQRSVAGWIGVMHVGAGIEQEAHATGVASFDRYHQRSVAVRIDVSHVGTDRGQFAHQARVPIVARLLELRNPRQ